MIISNLVVGLFAELLLYVSVFCDLLILDDEKMWHIFYLYIYPSIYSYLYYYKDKYKKEKIVNDSYFSITNGFKHFSAAHFLVISHFKHLHYYL